jgi:hypothetical protein
MEEIKKVIAESYVQAVFVDRDVEAMQRGFHPDFVMSILKDGTLDKRLLSEWITMVEAGKARNPQVTAAFSHEVDMLDVTGNVAMSKVKLYKDSTLIFTDYLSLYRFPEGWRIVNKVFQAH